MTVLAAHGVGFGYGAARLFADVSVAVGRGELVGLLGPNGAGKTTLVRLLAGVLAPDAGAVTLDGRALPRSRRERARAIAFVPQDPRVEFPFTVMEVVLMGRAPYLSGLGFAAATDLRLARGALAALGVEELAGRRLDSLSGGERQRVFLARALVQEPRALLLDEPTTHLDLRHQGRILDVVRRRARDDGLGALAVLHDLNLAAVACDRLVLLAGGRILADGAARDVLTRARITEAFATDVHVGTHGAADVPAVLPLPPR